LINGTWVNGKIIIWNEHNFTDELPIRKTTANLLQ